MQCASVDNEVFNQYKNRSQILSDKQVHLQVYLFGVKGKEMYETQQTASNYTLLSVWLGKPTQSLDHFISGVFSFKRQKPPADPNSWILS